MTAARHIHRRPAGGTCHFYGHTLRLGRPDTGMVWSQCDQTVWGQGATRLRRVHQDGNQPDHVCAIPLTTYEKLKVKH